MSLLKTEKKWDFCPIDKTLESQFPLTWIREEKKSLQASIYDYINLCALV